MKHVARCNMYMLHGHTLKSATSDYDQCHVIAFRSERMTNQEQAANPTNKFCALILDVWEKARHRRQQTVTMFLAHKYKQNYDPTLNNAWMIRTDKQRINFTEYFMKHILRLVNYDKKYYYLNTTKIFSFWHFSLCQRPSLEELCSTEYCYFSLFFFIHI